MTDKRIILGVDPGTNVLGFGVISIDCTSSKPRFLDMGVVDLRKVEDPYEKLSIIRNRISQICETFNPTDLAIESPFYGKNAQVIFKLGRAQGAAIVAAVEHGMTVNEYAPRKAKVAICGNGSASKEQVAMMVEKILNIDIRSKFLDATDALAIAMCHYYQLSSPLSGLKSSSSWEKFIKENPERVK